MQGELLKFVISFISRAKNIISDFILFVPKKVFHYDFHPLRQMNKTEIMIRRVYIQPIFFGKQIFIFGGASELFLNTCEWYDISLNGTYSAFA